RKLPLFPQAGILSTTGYLYTTGYFTEAPGMQGPDWQAANHRLDHNWRLRNKVHRVALLRPPAADHSVPATPPPTPRNACHCQLPSGPPRYCAPYDEEKHWPGYQSAP